MIEHVRGRLLSAAEGSIVIDAGGLGLRLRVPAAAAFRARVGRLVTVPAYLDVSRRGAVLYGFASAEEREAFTAILRLPGIGPATALKLLPELPRLRADPAAAVPALRGVGPAKRARLARWLRRDAEGTPESARDLVGALRALGLTGGEARTRAAGVRARHPGASLEELVRHALRRGAGPRAGVAP